MDAVKVAVRIRPLVQSETENGCRSCIERIPKMPQISIGKNNNQSFSFNYVFDENEGQAKVYNESVKPLIDNLFKGYNLTIVAYGQTGSGKTFTMGTNYTGEGELGIIPRAIYEIFEKISSMSEEYSFGLSCSFLELYNECLYDLLTDKPREQSMVDMREASTGICIPGLTVVNVTSPENILDRLKEGSYGRVVGSTAMNSQSSRSHAVFTINIKILHKEDPKQAMTSKLQLVDLAGSERSKKTLATGDRFKEGVNINKGLLVLGNVISQLGDGQTRFINYRDSKLTRFLQDSLGGNSVTLMIACVSPADYNQDESLSTLRYADRAKRIKNKPMVNQDPTCAELARLRKENEELRLAMIGYGTSGCPPSHRLLEEQLELLKRKNREISSALRDTVAQNNLMLSNTVLFEKSEELIKDKLTEVLTLPFGCMNSEEISQAVKDRLKDIESEIVHVRTQRILEERQIHNDAENADDEDDCHSNEAESCRQEHFLSQAKINKEILLLNKQMMWKEELVSKLTDNSQQLGEIGTTSQENVADLKNQIASFQKERDDLIQQIKTGILTASNNTAKVSEQRRKRLHELEQKVSELSKKVNEQEKIISMKKNSDEKIKALRNDILAAKQLKVKLIQQMRSENDKFRSFKQEKDREMHAIRSQNMKKQNELRKMEQMHSMQQNVLRRKLEAAAAANKRIKAVLDRQKAAAIMKRARSGPVTERIKEKLVEELEMIESAYQAERSLESLIQDRGALTKELTVVKEALDDNEVSHEEKIKLNEDMKNINKELEMRSAEIADLQEKLLDLQQGNSDDFSKGNWEILQTMADAKFALTFLFNAVTDKIKDSLIKCQSLIEARDKLADNEIEITSLRRRVDDFETFHRQTVNRIEKEAEEKIHVLLQRLNDSNMENKDEVISESIRIQADELAKVNALRLRIIELEAQIPRRRSMPKSPVVSTYEKEFINYIDGDKDKTFIVPTETTKQASKRKMEYSEGAVGCSTWDDGIEEDDTDKDPDWVRTPIFRRLQSLKVRSKVSRTSQDIRKCKCRSDCEGMCPCSKGMSRCHENCTCDPSVCTNKSDRRDSNDALDVFLTSPVSPKKLRFTQPH